MHWKEKFEKLIPKFKSEDKSALAKMISLVEENPTDSWHIISKLQSEIPPKNSHVIGITGSPGVGKSTFISQLIEHYTRKKEKIGIILIDPSSPFTGGAFLGDRVRMFSSINSSNVYIRSLASRGAVGGVCNAIYDITDIMKSFGFDKIIIETVGAGQSEIDIFYACDTTILLLSPDSGDEIQIYKAGIMEIADFYVVNKIDLANSKRFLMYLESYFDTKNEGKKKIFGISSTERLGFEELFDNIELNKKEKIDQDSKLLLREKNKIKYYFLNIIENFLEESILKTEDINSLKDEIFKFLCRGESNNAKED